MTLPRNPRRGMTLLKFTCIDCNAEGFFPIRSVKKVPGENKDGSTCYIIKFTCSRCDYLNGQYRPIWYNVGHAGCVHGGGVRQ